MSLNLVYNFREGWSGLRRARLASVVTVSTVALTLFLFSCFTVLTINIRRIVETFKKKMSIEVFIDNSQNQEQVFELKNRLLRIVGVQEAVFISQEEALKKFREEFEEDPLSLLGENPLPSSFQITLMTSYLNPSSAEEVVKRISQLDGVEEVVYHGKLFRIVDKWSHVIIIVDLCLLFVVLISALLLISNTLRLTIFAQSKNIQIMVLIGATKGFIRRSYLIQGIIEGGIGGTIAALVLWLVVRSIMLRFPYLLRGEGQIILMTITLGILLGFFGSLIGLKRFLKA